MATIDFPPDQFYDDWREVVVFPAIATGKRIRCAISMEALGDYFGGYRDDPLSTFVENRDRIEKLATKLILDGRFEPDGSLLIRSNDIG